MISMIMNWHVSEMIWIRQLQGAMRSPLLDLFFLGWNFVDSLPFMLIMVSTVWYLIDRRIGVRLLYILILSAVVNGFLKAYFDMPRPCQDDPLVGLLCFTNNGFPSGAAQTAVLICGIIFKESKKWLWRSFGLLFALMLSFSRLYLGVHYFSDIAGGILIGALLLLVYWKLIPLLQEKWRALIFLFPVLILPLDEPSNYLFFGTSLGLAVGLLFAQKKPWKRSLLQTLIAIGGSFLFLGSISLFPDLAALLGFGAGLWISFVVPSLQRKGA